MEATDVHGLVPREQLEHLRGALTIQGIADEHVEVRDAPPGHYLLHDETLHEDAAAARRGAGAGTVIGALLGLVVALLVPALAGLGPTLVTVAAVGGFGALVGAMAGLQRVEHHDGDPDTYREVTPDDDVVLVSVHHEHWHNRAHHLMERHGAEFLQEPEPTTASGVQPDRR